MKISIEVNKEEAAILKQLAAEKKRTFRAQAEWVLSRQLLEIKEKREEADRVVLNLGNSIPLPRDTPRAAREANPTDGGQGLGEGEKEAQIGA